MGAGESVRRFIRAWNTDAAGERLSLLLTCCIPTAVFVSPQGETIGLDAFSASVEAFRLANPQAKVINGPVATHHGHARFRWQTHWHNGLPPLVGDDIVELNAGGLITKVVSFDRATAPALKTPLLVILGGLPGSGKTSISKELARSLDGIHLRVDTIEHAIVTSGMAQGPLVDAGYRVAYALAGDNLRLGRIVVADTVNPFALTRDAWREVAGATDAAYFEVEAVCSDQVEHRRRVETRAADIEGLKLPTWQEVIEREYEPWPEAALVLDTSTLSVEACVAAIWDALPIA
jgi:predicted kinase